MVFGKPLFRKRSSQSHSQSSNQPERPTVRNWAEDLAEAQSRHLPCQRCIEEGSTQCQNWGTISEKEYQMSLRESLNGKRSKATAAAPKEPVSLLRQRSSQLQNRHPQCQRCRTERSHQCQDSGSIDERIYQMNLGESCKEKRSKFLATASGHSIQGPEERSKASATALEKTFMGPPPGWDGYWDAIDAANDWTEPESDGKGTYLRGRTRLERVRPGQVELSLRSTQSNAVGKGLQTRLPDIIDIDMSSSYGQKPITKQLLPWKLYLPVLFLPFLEDKFCYRYKDKLAIPDFLFGFEGTAPGSIRSLKGGSSYVLCTDGRETTFTKDRPPLPPTWRFWPTTCSDAPEQWQWQLQGQYVPSKEWILKDSWRGGARWLATFKIRGGYSLRYEKGCVLSDASRREVFISAMALMSDLEQKKREAREREEWNRRADARREAARRSAARQGNIDPMIGMSMASMMSHH